MIAPGLAEWDVPREAAEAVARIWLVNANVEATPERVESLTRLILGVRKAALRRVTSLR